MTELADELKKLRLPLAGGISDDDFVGGVMAACSSDTRRAPSASGARTYGALLALAACVALGLSLRATRPEEVVAARGNRHDSGVGAIVQAFVGNAAPGGVPQLLEGARLRPGDGILLRYSNPASTDSYLMVFALDERGSVHWIHPAYLNEADNPTSVRLAREVTQRVLPEVAEPEDAAPGPLRVYALLTRTSLDVKGVEARITGSRAQVEQLFPEAEVEEWRCTWTP